MMNFVHSIISANFLLLRCNIGLLYGIGVIKIQSVSMLLNVAYVMTNVCKNTQLFSIKALAPYTGNCTDFSKKAVEKIVAAVVKNVVVFMEDNCLFLQFL